MRFVVLCRLLKASSRSQQRADWTLNVQERSVVGVRLWVSFYKSPPNWTLQGDPSSQLAQEDGWKTQKGRITKKCRASLAQHFIVILPSCCVRSLLMQTQPLTLKFQTVGFSLWLNRSTLMEIRGLFLESPESFRANFGWKFSLYLRNKGVSKQKTLIYFKFLFTL